MAVLSLDLAYNAYADIGAVVMYHHADEIRCELLNIPLEGQPRPERLAGFLDHYCSEQGIRILLLDGPQGWKAANSDLIHSRRCEKELNTPAKTGLPGVVKPANYRPFVVFSIATFDALAALGWQRLSSLGGTLQEHARIALESFPLSAWRALRIAPLPAKAKTTEVDLVGRTASLTALAPVRISGNPTHDQLQAIVSGFAGLAFERGDWTRCAVAGIALSFAEGCWREGYILNATRHTKALTPDCRRPGARVLATRSLSARVRPRGGPR